MAITAKRAAIIGFGEAGKVMASALHAGSEALSQPLEIHAWDIMAADPARGPGLHEAAARERVTLHDNPGPWLNGMDVIFSLVFGHAAKEVARDILPFLNANAAYVDLTSAEPEDMREAYGWYTAQKISFLDGTALGSFRTNGKTVPFVLSGEGAAGWANWMNERGFNVRPVTGTPGLASTIKLLRTVMTKGIQALAIECFAAAERLGLREAMAEAFSDYDARPFAACIEDQGCSHVLHYRRRLAEVEKALHLLEGLGIDPIMTRASSAFYRRSADAAPECAPENAKTWDSALPVLLRVVQKQPG